MNQWLRSMKREENVQDPPNEKEGMSDVGWNAAKAVNSDAHEIDKDNVRQIRRRSDPSNRSVAVKLQVLHLGGAFRRCIALGYDEISLPDTLGGSERWAGRSR